MSLGVPDSDNDGWCDAIDPCPYTPGIRCCGDGDCASDENCENCPQDCGESDDNPDTPPPTTTTPPDNPCDDFDRDGVPDYRGNCPTIKNGNQWDEDGDGVGNMCDFCLTLPGPRDQPNNDGNGCPCDVNKKHELEKLEKELRHQAEIKDDGSDIIAGASIGMGILSLILIPWTGGGSLIYWIPAILSGSASVGSGIVSVYEDWSADQLREEADRLGNLASQYTDGC